MLFRSSVASGTRWVGMSDMTSLQLGLLAHADGITWAGPLACDDFGRSAAEGGVDDVTAGCFVEAMSGDVQDVEISAKAKTGLDDLLEKIALQAELLELKARPDRMAEATVIEAQLDKGRGPVATVLITRGTLKRGDTFVVGTESGRVRAIVDDKGKQIKEAGPSMPVEVLGLGGVPSAGDTLTVVENEQRDRKSVV